MKIKNIVVLAGGDSTRFWPLNNKCFFNFLNKPFLFYLISSLINYSENFFLVVNSLTINEAKILIKKYFHSEKIFLIEQKDLKKGMAGAILSLKDKIKGEVIIINGSDYLNFDFFKKYTQFIRKNNFKISFVGKRFDNYFPGGYFLFKNKKIAKIVEKPNPNQLPSKLVKLVCDYFCNFDQLIFYLTKINSLVDDIYEQAINFLIKNNTNIGFYLYTDKWQALKYPWDVLSMMDIFLKEKLRNEVFFGKNVKLGKYAKIIGPTYIGDNTFIGDYTLIINSHIGNDCVVGGFSEVTRSYLGDKVFLHRNYVGDSVLSSNVLMGAEAVLANFRFDGKNIYSLVQEKRIDTQKQKLGSIIGENSRVGVNATVLPGVKIGKNTFIGPAEVVREDVTDNKFFYKNQIKENKFLKID